MENSYPRDYLYRRLVDAKLYIDNHYLDNINAEAIAANACFSKYHFIRLFRSSYKITPHQYLTLCRIKKAKELLKAGMSVSDTCSVLNFSSLSSFNKLFKRHVKIIPSTYVSNYRRLTQSVQQHPLNHIPGCFIDYMGWNK